jgi:hypothetical protein
MKLRHLKTAKDVIAELGGFEAVTELTNTAGSSTAPTWQWRGKFPPKTFAVMMAALQAKGSTAPVSLWGMIEAQSERAVS